MDTGKVRRAVCLFTPLPLYAGTKLQATAERLLETEPAIFRSPNKINWTKTVHHTNTHRRSPNHYTIESQISPKKNKPRYKKTNEKHLPSTDTARTHWQQGLAATPGTATRAPENSTSASTFIISIIISSVNSNSVYLVYRLQSPFANLFLNMYRITVSGRDHWFLLSYTTAKQIKDDYYNDSDKRKAAKLLQLLVKNQTHIRYAIQREKVN